MKLFKKVVIEEDEFYFSPFRHIFNRLIGNIKLWRIVRKKKKEEVNRK